MGVQSESSRSISGSFPWLKRILSPPSQHHAVQRRVPVRLLGHARVGTRFQEGAEDPGVLHGNAVVQGRVAAVVGQVHIDLPTLQKHCDERLVARCGDGRVQNAAPRPIHRCNVRPELYQPPGHPERPVLSCQGQGRLPIAVPGIHIQSCGLQERVQREEVVRDSRRM